MSTQALKLFTCTTPNGYKVSMVLEALKLKYDAEFVHIMQNEQKQDWFLKLNPNGRIPTLVDNSTGVTVSETAAIMQYLVDTYDKENKISYKVGTKEYYKQLEILYFQMAGVGPMQGQANHFAVFTSEKIPYAIDRYVNETKRLYSVVEEYLTRNKDNGLYLVGDHYCIADFAIFSWAIYLEGLKIDIQEWPLTGAWFNKMSELPEVKKGFTVPGISDRLPEEFKKSISSYA